MSAANLILRDDAAYLITDAAALNDDGTIDWIGSKVLNLAHLGLALSIRGRIHPPTLGREIIAMGAQTAVEFLQRLPDAFFSCICAQKAMWPKVPQSEWSSSLSIAAWLPDQGRPYCFLLASDNDWVPRPYEPWTLLSVLDSFAPSPPDGWALPASEPFDAQAAGLALLSAQRPIKHEIGGQMHFAVGGFGELTRVAADGVTTTRVCEWPDQVGQAIDPEAEMRAVDI